MGSGELAGSVLPSYEVGGDWFDYVENRDGAWIAIADGAGRGPRAAGLSSVALAALRAGAAQRRTLEQAAQLMDETVAIAGGPEFFVTAILARWHPVYSLFSWINLGHPPPLLIGADGTVEELATRPDLPLGLTDRTRAFRRHQRRLPTAICSCSTPTGSRAAARRTGRSTSTGSPPRCAARGIRSATAAARAIQEAVVSASEDAAARRRGRGRARGQRRRTPLALRCGAERRFSARPPRAAAVRLRTAGSALGNWRARSYRYRASAPCISRSERRIAMPCRGGFGHTRRRERRARRASAAGTRRRSCRPATTAAHLRRRRGCAAAACAGRRPAAGRGARARRDRARPRRPRGARSRRPHGAPGGSRCRRT